MAAPAEVTIKDLSGEWVMNKTLSDDADAVLALQGVGWFMRKAIALATVTLHLQQYEKDGVTHVDIRQTATGGIKGTDENREFDWTFREHDDHIFGHLKGKSRWATLEIIDDDFLKEGWLDGEGENGGPNGEKHVQSLVVNEQNQWTAEQVWGFATIDGTRYYTRRVVVKSTKSSGEVYKLRLIYNWSGKN